MEVVLKKDLALLTTIKETTLSKLNPIINKLICDYILDAKNKGEDNININLDFGVLNVSLLDGVIKYKFIPSEDLEKQIITTYLKNTSPIVESLEQAIVDRFENIYKDLM
jgi:hypothetical protein